jgi:hypothetical protein
MFPPSLPKLFSGQPGYRACCVTTRRHGSYQPASDRWGHLLDAPWCNLMTCMHHTGYELSPPSYCAATAVHWGRCFSNIVKTGDPPPHHHSSINALYSNGRGFRNTVYFRCCSLNAVVSKQRVRVRSPGYDFRWFLQAL